MATKTTTTGNRPDLVSIAEAAERLGVATRTIRDRIADGQLPAFRVGQARGAMIRIKVADLDALLHPIVAGSNTQP